VKLFHVLRKRSGARTQQAAGGGWGGATGPAQDDPWATPAASTGGGWGNGPDKEPPF
jgi:single-strand DNA-binding protein